MTRLLRISLAALLLVPAGAGAVAHRGATPTRGDFAGRVSIGGGRELYLMCLGTGPPTVLLEAGLRNRGDIWSTPAEEGDKRTTVYQLASLAPAAQHVIATHSGHYIQLDQPGLVRAAVKRVVDAVRAGRRTVAARSAPRPGSSRPARG